MAEPQPRPRFREQLRPGDPLQIADLVRRSGVFSDEEVRTAARLAETTLDGSIPFRWLIAELAGRLAGFTCYDLIELTAGSYDLFWIAVAPEFAGSGTAGELIARTAAALRAEGGRKLYAETSARSPYARARGFYLKAGFVEAARIDDFYAPGDAKLIYCLTLA